jgi:hypothetical protein
MILNIQYSYYEYFINDLSPDYVKIIFKKLFVGTAAGIELW